MARSYPCDLRGLLFRISFDSGTFCLDVPLGQCFAFGRINAGNWIRGRTAALTPPRRPCPVARSWACRLEQAFAERGPGID